MTNALTVVQSVEASLWQREEAIRAILPDSMDLKRFVKTAMIALSKNPDLQKCTQESLVRSIIEAAEVGLEPTGMLSRAWLVPYNNKGVNEAQLQIGYQGLLDLARRSGEVRKGIARVVYEGDDFRVVQGSEERIEHIPAFLTEDPLKIEKVYAVVTFVDGTTQHEVMTKAQVDMVRARAKAKNADAWTNHYPEMARKTVVHRLCKYLPLTPEAVEAIQRDIEREFGPSVAPAAPTRTSSLKEALKVQAEEIEGVSVEISASDTSETAKAALADLKDALEAEGLSASIVSAPESTEVPPEPTPPRSFADEFASKVAAAQAQPIGPTKCGALSDPALGEIEECAMQAGHLGIQGSRQRHRAASGSVWPA